MHLTTRFTSGVLAALAAVLTLGLASCGDGSLCPTDLVVVISAPANGTNVTIDKDPDTAGVQTDVVVRSNFADGDGFTLTVAGIGTPYVGTSDSVGDVVFADVTLPAGSVSLVVVGESDKGCGTASDEASVQVAALTGCDLLIREGTLTNDYYDLPVLNSTNDSDSGADDFQANIDVTTLADFDVELFVTDTAETSAGTATADGDGDASFALTLGQGQKSVRAVCKSSNGSITRDSGATVVFVDTVVPMCTLTPAAETTIIPDMDINETLNGTQIVLAAHLTDDDVSGESASFTVGALNILTPAIDASGDTEVTATFDTQGDVAIAFLSQDHAGNPCSINRDHTYVTEGCLIDHVAPSDVVTTDSNGIPGDGLQTNLVVQVADACVGKTVTTTCDITGEQTATVPTGGTTTIEVTLCNNATCDTTMPNQLDCATRVTNDDGITTSAGAAIEADTQPPSVQLQGYNPIPIPCGQVVTDSVDADIGSDNGVQIQILLLAPGSGLTTTIELTNATNPGTLVTPVASAVTATFTLDPGTNDFVGVAVDPYGNDARTATCTITLADIAIAISPPANDGLVGGPDGTVSGSDLTFDLCGTVSEADAGVELFFDGSLTPQVATVSGMTWCLYDVTLAEGDHTFDVQATGVAGGGLLEDVALEVDVTAPPTPVIVDVTATDRQSALMQWTAAGSPTRYIVKYHDDTLDEGNFDTTGTMVTPPSPSGGTKTFTFTELWAGTAYDFAVASVDVAGNRSPIAVDHGTIPLLDASGAILPADPGSGAHTGFGYAMARGLFNNDDYYDLAISAPFQHKVYVFLGSATGLATTPDFTIEGAVDVLFGHGLTAIHWNGDDRHDLAIGAPTANGYSGEVRIFFGGTTFDVGSPATIAASASDVYITASSAGGTNWYSFGVTGWSLATADFDGDNKDDLIIGSTNGGGGPGGATVLYGGATATTINLHDNLDSAGYATEMDGAVASLIKYPDTPSGMPMFGHQIFNLGRTQEISTTDDIAIVSFSDAAPSNDTAYVFRGRTGKPSEGVAEITFSDALDLAIVNPSTDATTYYGDTMGSIANATGGRDIVISAFTQGAGVVWIVDGAAVGTRDVDDTEFVLTTISNPSGTIRWGTAILNNAASSSPDIDHDGIEDLVITGGHDDVYMYVWFGNALPGSDPEDPNPSADTAHYVIAAPTTFVATTTTLRKGPMAAIWAGDLNDDGLEDICWADHSVPDVSNNTLHVGSMEYLFDL